MNQLTNNCSSNHSPSLPTNENVLELLSHGEGCFYENTKVVALEEWYQNLPFSKEDMEDALERLERFAPLIEQRFPETMENKGIIESPLARINGVEGSNLYLKMDSHLAVAGSVKARGGIYEVLKHTEELLCQKMNWNCEEDYRKILEPQYREFLSQHKIQVGSTGNLGLSIGIMSAVLGFQVVVHMSSDAKQWKKDLLRKYGVTVVEYEDDYSKAVEEGRKQSDLEENSYFVDDENSKNLFLGYSVAAFRLKTQLEEMKIAVDEEHPLFVYIPCGVGGAPGGVTYGLKYVFGNAVHCYFIEPTQAPCMLLGMATGRHNGISVKDIGLSGNTIADGLAVGRASGLVGKVMEPILDGLFTVEDERLIKYLRWLYDGEHIFIEPSACAGFFGYEQIAKAVRCGNNVNSKSLSSVKEYVEKNHLQEKITQGTHIVWATGGSLVPEEERQKNLGNR